MKGSGTPVKGNIATMLPRFIIACMEKSAKIPPERRKACLSGEFLTTRKILKRKVMYKMRKTSTPKKPSSSAIIANIESVVASGRNKYFCLDAPNPRPQNPPDPKEINICLI
jgi:hypothetical protein